MNVSSDNSIMSKVMGVFFLSLLVSVAGLFVGQYIPNSFILPIAIAELIILLVVIFSRKKKVIGYPLLYLFMFLSGITLFVSLSYYVSTLGAGTVLKAFGIATAAFGFTALYAYKTKNDFSYLGGFLFTSLILLVITTLVGIFVPFGSTLELLISGFGILIFVGYTLYDFNMMAKKGYTEDDVPLMVLNIYLDFVNLFLYILRFLNILSKD